ncbi:carbohydrate binding domain-containing protein [Epilithonimonas zeae]|uniref:Por secretion system C-terminal sorting domain-containing protein n=1 Tax=Epilithonimonas zeae TaxID=1416779 RepID=A0A1N6E8X5_9FLAO|nr:carbohydrate binding domain-containing protein [Epilithonimonas zeae]SIN79367.1 Por secretion system C-terminal sorting domain-containing protein [Epilithonimonas zeae]
MKKIFTILSVAAVSLVSAQNLVVNGGFESGLAPWTAGTGTGYTAPTISTTDAHTGSNSATYSPSATTGFFQNVPVTEGKTYVISFWYKTSSASAARLWSIYKNASGAPVYTTPDNTTDPFRTNNKYLPAAAVWTQYTAEMPAGTAVTNLDVAIRAYGGTTSSFDDVMAYEKGTMAVVDFSKDKYSLVKNTVVGESIAFAKTADIQIINAAGQVVKAAKVIEGSTLNVASLAKGVYIVTGSVNGEKVAQKVIKN